MQILAMLPEDPQLALRILERAVEILEQLDKCALGLEVKDEASLG
jgi:hypothetical protein